MNLGAHISFHSIHSRHSTTHPAQGHSHYAHPHLRPRSPHPLSHRSDKRRLHRRLERNTRPKSQLATSRALPQWTDDVHECRAGALFDVLYVADISYGAELTTRCCDGDDIWESVLGDCVQCGALSRGEVSAISLANRKKVWVLVVLAKEIYTGGKSFYGAWTIDSG